MYRNPKYRYGAQFCHNYNDPDSWTPPTVDIDRAYTLGNGFYRRIWLHTKGYPYDPRINIPNTGRIALELRNGPVSISYRVAPHIREMVRMILDDGAPVEPLLDALIDLWPELGPVVQLIVAPPPFDPTR